MEKIQLENILKIETDTISWKCPHCDAFSTLNQNDIKISNNYYEIKDNTGYNLQTKFVFCPNPDCKKYSIYVSVYKASRFYRNGYTYIENNECINGKQFFPEKKIREFPNYIPEVIINDYREACLISELSPKASATIARRCLQGIIRDFWHVKPDNLNKEIDQIKDKIDELTYNAIDSVRKIGNIGAHMEKDINLIIEVDENEALLLINLLEILIENWYVAKHDKEERLAKIKILADEKDKIKKK